METRKILVTGGAGFIAGWIVKELVKRQYNDIYVIDDLSGGNIDNIKGLIDDEKINFINLDLSSIHTKDAIEKIKPEIIFHLAANAREGASFFQPLNVTKRNYYAYINTLEPAIKTRKLDKVILFSSMAVYGNQKVPFAETMNRMPVDIYGIDKSSMEHSTELLADVHNFNYTIIRPFNVFGINQTLRDKYRNVVTIMANKIMRKDPLIIYGDGEQKRAFSYIEDSLSCYIKAMEDDKTNGEIINIGGKIPISVNKLAELICECMGIDPTTYPIEHVNSRFGEVPNAWCSTEKSERLLDYKENIGHEVGIRKTVEWAKSIGRQTWTEEKLEIWNSKAPEWWK